MNVLSVRARARRLRTPGIDLKIQILVGLGFILGIGLVLSYQTYARISAAHQDRRDANIHFVQTLSGPAISALGAADPNVIYSYMEILSIAPRAAGIVFASGGKIVQSQQSVSFLDLAIEDLSRQTMQSEASASLLVQEEGDYQFVSAPIRDADSRIKGSIGMAWNTRGELDGVWRDALIQAFALALIAAAILTSISFFARRLLTRPLRSIARQMDCLSDPGCKAVYAPVPAAYTARRDEIGSVARALDELRRRSAEVHTLNEHLDACLSNMAQGLCMFDADSRLVICNARYGAMYDIPMELLTPGTSLRRIVQLRIANGIFAGEDPNEYLEERLNWGGLERPASTVQQLNDGRTISISRQPTACGGWVSTHTDISDIRRIEDRIAHMAHHDPLTDLPNRSYLRERIEDLLQNARKGEQCAVLCLDLDRFKPVNDVYGHPVGDKLLRAVADRLRSCVRGSDVVGRLGGDEFTIIQQSHNQPQDAAVLASRICETLAMPFDLGDQEVIVGTSIGISIAPVDGRAPDVLFKNADLALYRAKNDGRGRYRFFEAEMDEMAQQRRELELELRKALLLNQFELYYQPLLDLKLGEISGFEALLRWNHPTRGIVSPTDFIPIAEEIGMIVPLGEWVIRAACRQAAGWPGDTHIAVNLSPLQFRSDHLVRTVADALESAGLKASRLELEITESVLLQDDPSTLDKLHSLHDLGVRIAMDDFGTGYSSLSYLRSFPFDKIKIDRSFVQDLSGAGGENAIVNAVASMCRSLGIATTAEGVETEEQFKLVKAAGYNEIQGYLISQPQTAGDVARYFASLEEGAADVA